MNSIPLPVGIECLETGWYAIKIGQSINPFMQAC